MTSWPVVGQLTAYTDATTGATPLALMKQAIYGNTDALSQIPDALSLLIGQNGGCLGEVSSLALLYRLMAKSRQMGMFSLERDIENPRESEIFASYPRILADSVMLDFIVDYLRLIISGHMNTFEIEALMDEEIETHESEAEVPANSLALVGDSLPAFGIVAAVMGVVHALGSADRPAAELGALIAHAMVGTFLGILLAYGFISPLASVLRQKSAETSKMMQCVKVTLLSNLNGYAPPIAVEFGRKTLYSSERPSFIELEEHVRAVKNPQQQTTTEEA